jgi:aspartoacylase
MVWPVFINEAAYEEKGIALSVTERKIWPADAAWGNALVGLMQKRPPEGGPN